MSARRWERPWVVPFIVEEAQRGHRAQANRFPSLQRCGAYSTFIRFVRAVARCSYKANIAPGGSESPPQRVEAPADASASDNATMGSWPR